MTSRKLALAAVLVVSAFGLASCGNTIRGVGKDTANAVDATQQAGQGVENAAN